MNIYLLRRTDDWSYDDYDAAVVIAENEEAAKRLHPANEWADNVRFRALTWHEEAKVWYQGDSYVPGNYESYHGWVDSLDNISVTFLGPSQETEARTVLGSFNAG